MINVVAVAKEGYDGLDLFVELVDSHMKARV
jgi:hypothetical protein